MIERTFERDGVRQTVNSAIEAVGLIFDGWREVTTTAPAVEALPVIPAEPEAPVTAPLVTDPSDSTKDDSE